MGRSQDVFIFILFFNHYKSDNRCDLCRCTVRSSSARPIYPRNRRGKIRRLASLHVCCARLISRGAVCIATDDHTRIRSSRCPNPVSSRPCTSLAATCGMPRPIAGGGSSSGTAAICTCRVGEAHLSNCGGTEESVVWWFSRRVVSPPTCAQLFHVPALGSLGGKEEAFWKTASRL